MLLKVLYLLCLVISAFTIESAEKMCDYEADDLSKSCYKKEILVSLSHSPNQLTVDHSTNNLYFSFDFGQGEYIPAKIAIGNNTVMVLKGIKDAFAMASDQKSEEIYFGGSHGIYRYLPREKKLKRLALVNLDIWWLVFNKGIYFIKFPSLSAYKYENRTIKYMYELKSNSVHQFVFDNDGNIFFLNNTGLYGIKSQEYDAQLIADYPRFLGLATDNKGIVYLCNEDGIYILTKVILKVKRLVSLQGVLGLTFDRYNNIIYSDSHEIVRLVPINKENYL